MPVDVSPLDRLGEGVREQLDLAVRGDLGAAAVHVLIDESWLERRERKMAEHGAECRECAVVPGLSRIIRPGNTRALPTLRAVFGHLPLTLFKPRLVYQYVDRRGAKIAAHREIEVLSHAFTKAVEWGYIDRHPFKGEVRLEGEPPRTRYVEDWEVVEALALKPRRKAGSVLAVQAYIRMKLLTGMRRGDLLRLRPAHDCKEDGTTSSCGRPQ